MTTKERNDKLLEFFHHNGFKSVRYIGNPAIPAVIAFEDTVLSCHVSGDLLYFTDKPKEGNVVWTVDLGMYDWSKVDVREQLIRVIDESEHRHCYRIKLVGGRLKDTLEEVYGTGELFLTDYHYNRETREKTPQFVPGKDVKLYFEYEQAVDAVEKIHERARSEMELKIV